MSENLGVIPCPLCAARALVRKFGKGRRMGQLYINCPTAHGNFMNEGRDFQGWILDHAVMAGPDGALPPFSPPVTMPAAAPGIEPEPPVSAPAPAPVTPRAPRASLFPLFS